MNLILSIHYSWRCLSTSYLAMQDTYVRIVEWISEAKLFAGGRFS